MKLRAIRLNEVRQFTRPVQVTGIGEGVNVLSAPNESGKSTLFDAIHAVLFIPHRSAKIRSLRPAVGGNPEITLEIEHEGAALTLFKRWGRGAAAEVRRGDVVIARADEAEAMISGLTQAPDQGGPAGLLWVRQGVTEFDSKDAEGKDPAARKSRADLLSSVGAEFEELTGGRRMDRALARAQAELDVQVTSRGARAGGPLAAAILEAEALERSVDELSARAHQLRDALDERRAKRRQLAELTEPAEVARRQAALEKAEADCAAAERHAGLLQGARSALEAAGMAREQARREIETRAKTGLAVETLAARRAEAGARAEALEARARTAAGARHRAEAAQQAARGERQAAERRHDAALQAEARRGRAAERARLATALAQAEALAATLPDLRRAAASGPDAAQLEAIDKAARALAVAEELARAAAPQIAFDALPGVAPLSLDGVELDARPRPVTEPAALDLPGLGVLRLVPGAGDSAGRLARAREALAQALGQAGVEAPDKARAAARARAEAAQQLRAAQEGLARLAPEGIDSLRAALAALAEDEAPAGDAPDPAPDIAAVRAALQAARTAEETAESAAQAARAAQEPAQVAALEARHDAAGLAQRLDEARAALDALADAPALDAALTRAEAAHDTALRAHAALAAEAPDLDASRAALARARSVSQGAADEAASLRIALAGLDERVARLSGEAVEAELADAEARLATARETRAALEREVAVLRRLIAALQAAQSAARDRYFEPVLAELRPMLRLLWPGSELAFDEDSLLPVALIRDGRREEIGTLSGGTREQIALLVRLAFARLLAQSGRPAPVILDDALVFTDDDRMESMFDALTAQAADLQILVLSCRNRALRELGGRKLRFDAVAPA